MGRPPGNALDPDSRATLAHRRQFMQAFRMPLASETDGESEIRRAILGKNITERSRLTLERTFLFPLRFADREPDDHDPQADSRLQRQVGDAVSSHPEDCLDPEVAYQTGESSFLKSDFGGALNWFGRSHELYQGSDRLLASVSKVKMASCYWFVDQSRRAMKLLAGELDFLDGKVGDTGFAADAHEVMGGVTLIRGGMDEAEYHYQRAFDGTKDSVPVIAGNAQYGLVHVKLTRAVLSRSVASLDQRSIVQTAIQFYRDGGSSIGRANCNFMRGCIAIAKRQMDEATEWLESALKCYDEADNNLGRALCFEILGDLHAFCRLHDEAIDHRAKAWIFFPRSDSTGYLESLKDRMRLEHMLIQAGYSRLLLARYL